MKNIAILGAGFAGLHCALDLEKKLGKMPDYSITLIDKNELHGYTPLYYEVASGFMRQKRGAAKQLREGVEVTIPRLDAITKERRLEFIKTEVSNIDFEKNVIHGSKGLTVQFDYLVLALGAEIKTFNIPGVDRHMLTVKTIDSALQIREKIQNFIQKKKEGEEASIDIVISGGGPTGCELAAELTGFFKHEIQKGGFDWDDITITLIEMSDRLVRMFPPNISHFVKHRLEKLGVNVMLDTCVREAKAKTLVITPRDLRKREKEGELHCTFKGKKEIEADVAVWSAGIQPATVLKKMNLPLAKNGAIEINKNLNVKGFKNVFAIGDNCALIDPKTKHPLPALASIAIRQGHLAADNIVRSISEQKLRSYHFARIDTIIPLGGKYAIANLGNFHFKGFIAWILRKVVDLKYFLSILPLFKAINLWLKGALTYIKND